ncbi:MAG: SDR family oxidoreductase [Oceanihabitans sp.]
MYNTNHHTVAISELSFLVTGGAGFIGSNIVEYLLQYGAKKVRVLDNFSTGFKKNIEPFFKHPAFELLEGDIQDLETCKKAMQNIDYVSHQAALGSVPRSINDPITTNNVNISGFLNMLVALKETPQVKRMVYAASSSTYGDSKVLPKVEAVIGNPLSPYAVTKLVNEIYANVFGTTYNTNTVGLRYFNIFGPRQSPTGAYAAVIPLFMQALQENKAPTINGDGEQTRDFTFVENAVQANVKAFFASNEAKNKVFNIACGARISVNTLWKNLNQSANKNIPANHGPNRQGDVRDSLANIDMAKALLDYNPTVNVQQGLQRTWEAFTK